MSKWLLRLLGKKRPRHFIAIDIGSNTSIRSILFRREESGGNVALKKIHFELPRRAHEIDLLPRIDENLRRLLFEYLRFAGRVPFAGIVGIGNHFTFNEIATIQRPRKEPRKPLRHEELSALLRDFQEKQCERKVSGDTYALAHLMPFRVTIDGYTVDAANSHTSGTMIEITALATYALRAYWNSLKKLRLRWGGFPIEFVSNQAAIAAALVSLLETRDALLVKIGAKVTEVTMLSDGAICASGQFSFGGDDYTTAIAKRLSVRPKEAEQMKIQFGELALPQRTTEAVREALTDANTRWFKAFVTFLDEQERLMIPEQLFLLGGGAKLALLRETLTTGDWYKPLTFLDRIDVRVLNAEDLSQHTFANTAHPLKGPQEAALAALAYRVGGQKQKNTGNV